MTFLSLRSLCISFRRKFLDIYYFIPYLLQCDTSYIFHLDRYDLYLGYRYTDGNFYEKRRKTTTTTTTTTRDEKKAKNKNKNMKEQEDDDKK